MIEGNTRDLPPWERQTLEKILLAQVVEQRRARRWGIFFKLLLFVYLFALLLLVRGPDWTTWLDFEAAPTEHVALINIDGLIASDTLANAEDLNQSLREAFAHAQTRAVMLRINSGGGSPVQSALVHAEILRLRALHPDIPVYAVIADIGASGAYYIAAAANEIYASPSSIVGSIGVRLDSFGVVDLMEKWGVERRLFMAGEAKGLLDPFLPLRDMEIQHIEHLIAQVHQEFIAAVRQGRGDRLQEDPTLFTGLFWTGSDAQRLGLIDGFGDDRQVAREWIGIEEFLLFEPGRTVLELFLQDLGVSVGRVLAAWSGWDAGAGQPFLSWR